MIVVVTFLVFLVPTAAHFSLKSPPSWQLGNVPKNPYGDNACHSNTCEWYTNWTHLTTPPAIPNKSPFKTYTDVLGVDWTWHMPWRAPGTAKVFSPCGHEGGNPNGCGGDCQEGGYPFGPDGRSLGEAVMTYWKAGSTVEVATTIEVNHGGGYSFRLCKMPSDGDRTKLTEECFTKMPLDFVGDYSWIRFTNGSKEIQIPAMRLRNYTYPPGSQWSRNPIPAGGNTGGKFPGVGNGTQFPEPCPGCSGFSPVFRPIKDIWFYRMMLVDKLQVPANITGEYVLSMRWDCEQTPQIWMQCASITIVADNPPPPKAGPRCGDDTHACGFDCTDDDCEEWSANSVCTLSKAHCECSFNLDLDNFCCKGKWFNSTKRPAKTRCEGTTHACGIKCPPGTNNTNAIYQCSNWRSPGICTESKEACEGQCSGLWVAL